MQISKEKLGMNIRAAREGRGMSMEELARCIDKSVQDVEKMEAGKKQVTLVTAITICGALEIPYNDLFDGIAIQE